MLIKGESDIIFHILLYCSRVLLYNLGGGGGGGEVNHTSSFKNDVKYTNLNVLLYLGT